MDNSVVVNPFHYADTGTPAGYECSDCGASGAKLWREYQTFLENQDLRCFDCACKQQKKDPATLEGDSVGWFVPAVPTEDGSSYWGYTSVPQPGVEWWHRLLCSHVYFERRWVKLAG